MRPTARGDPGCDLRHLDRVGEAGAEVIVFGGDVHLALAREPAPRTRVLDAIEVALEAQPERIGLLGASTRARTDRTGRARGEREVELALALLAPLNAASDEPDRVGMRPLDDQFVHFLHTPRVPTT